MNRMLLGPDAEPTLLDQDITQFLSRGLDNVGRGDVEDFLKLYTRGAARQLAAQTLVARGVDPRMVSAALSIVETTQTIFTKQNVLGALTVITAVASGFHGYRRNQSVGWALAWFGSAMVFPVVTGTIAVAQGFGQRKA